MAQEELPDREADFLRFYEAEKGDLFGHLLYIGFAGHIADEATSEALTELYWSWFKVHTNRRMWVRTTARRIAGDKAGMTPAKLLKRLLAKGDRPGEGRHDTGIDAVVERNSDLVRAVNDLPRRQREVIALRMDGFTNKEIAAELRISERAVQDRVKKAGDAIRPMFATGEEKR
ncbi:sigma-70 family RNA polymerase sigma factor [Lentzea sp. NBC_00516]|uniref:RNA polymerase sigma factor n=1 Tax=Lentzea sp. NBC_00516 TaxID=2903582 RepID=UPI002E81BE47|nr:sigma-70 family RNA polymerase sigma factor [Lentzea sp. NBC_00516]WUD28733.1 sigma-70 family RNA polymerase sigma factor [Lentzea sp. NBC_00516]